ncbi:MAG: DUF4330 domain-containing protein [Ruminococcaceae bacterium]|nr:DUF4330 domain-containing protein [Oscillospiraceae bacterium]
MKIINEKGKLFGIINIIDLAVLLIVVLAAAFVGIKLFGNEITTVVAPQKEVTVTMRIRDALPYMYDELAAAVEEDARLVYGNQFDSSAKIVAMEKTPTYKGAFNDEGIVVWEYDTYKIDIIVTVTAKVPADSATFQFANQDVKTGRTFTLKTRTFETIAVIEAIRFN